MPIFEFPARDPIGSPVIPIAVLSKLAYATTKTSAYHLPLVAPIVDMLHPRPLTGVTTCKLPCE